MKNLLQVLFWGSLVIASACRKSDIGNDALKDKQKLYSFKLSLTGSEVNSSSIDRSSSLPDFSYLYVRIYNTVTGKLTLSTDLAKLPGADLPTLENFLPKGEYTATVIASRSSLQLSGNSITWNNAGFSMGDSSIDDTFYKKLSFSIIDQPVEKSLSLDRIIAGLSVVIEDAIPSDVKRIEVYISADKADYRFSDGNQTGSVSRFASFPLSPDDVGSTNKTLTSIAFGINTPTNVRLKAFDNSNAVLFEATVPDVTFRADKTTKVSGKLFTNKTSFKVTLNSVWDTPLPTVRF